ncbi:MAG TPA: redoxin domain-containing protein [Bryobacteraceae bacterium]|nr:redoxin domain-containing protein [Bryobacteraceae bacterium]HWB99299.1 redoxin domain-containing protein [Bryobacteraceae bacterium]
MASERVGVKVQAIGSPAADFSLTDLAGATHHLATEIAGRNAAVVVFWSGVCSHCNRYDDFLNTFAERHPDLPLLAIASRQQETREMLRRAVAERGLRFPILIDPGGVVARQWATEQTPRAFLLDSNCAIRYRGAIDNFQFPGTPDYEAYLEPAIADLLAGRPISQPDTPSFGCAIQSVYYQLPKIL